MSPDEIVEARAGRPRDPAVDAAILDAAAALFAEHGYAGVGMEGVAARAGVSKATLYRRYADKAELVVHAVRHSGQIPDELPDTGDLRADLRTMLSAFRERLAGPDGPLLLTVAAERIRHPDLAAAFERHVVGQKRDHTERLLRAAVARGDLPADADVALIGETGPAILWNHALHRLGFPEDLVDRILDLVLGPEA